MEQMWESFLIIQEQKKDKIDNLRDIYGDFWL